MEVTIRTTVETNEHPDLLAWRLADGMSDLLRSLDCAVGPRGIYAKVIGVPASVVHLDQEVPT